MSGRRGFRLSQLQIDVFKEAHFAGLSLQDAKHHAGIVCWSTADKLSKRLKLQWSRKTVNRANMLPAQIACQGVRMLMAQLSAAQKHGA